MTVSPSAADRQAHTERIAAVLAAHRLTTPRQCACEWRDEGDGWERQETWPDHVAAALMPLVDAIVAERAAEAIQAAADKWQWSAWADAPRIKGDVVAERIATAQYVTDWLRARAAALRAEGGDR